MNRGSLAAVLVFALGAGSAQAADNIDNIGGLLQGEFRDLSEDLGAAISYKALIPSEPLGITGFDIGIEMTTTTLEHSDIFDTACSGCGLDYVAIPKIHLHKGLPAGFDVGLMYASSSNTNVELIGYELRYANIEGGVTTPAVATRIHYSKLDGVDELSMVTKGIDVSISKGFAMFTPYAGIGKNWVDSDPSASTGLKSESFDQTKYFAGLNLNLGLLNFDFEWDETGGAQSLGAKIGFRF